MMGFANPMLKRGAGNQCAYGADGGPLQFQHVILYGQAHVAV
jgi:hypothetical protein